MTLRWGRSTYRKGEKLLDDEAYPAICGAAQGPVRLLVAREEFPIRTWVNEDPHNQRGNKNFC